MDPNATPQTLVKTLDRANSQFYPGVLCCSRNILTYSVSTCTAARSFSSMKRLKSPLRSTMTDERLSSLVILHIHKHENVDIDRLVTEFARLKDGAYYCYCAYVLRISRYSVSYG